MWNKSVGLGRGMERREYDKGTEVITTMPWGCFVRGKAVCPDGKVRSVRLALCADSFFSIPASVVFRGKRVTGFVTFAEDHETNRRWVEFIPNAFGKNSQAFSESERGVNEQQVEVS